MLPAPLNRLECMQTKALSFMEDPRTVQQEKEGKQDKRGEKIERIAKKERDSKERKRQESLSGLTVKV